MSQPAQISANATICSPPPDPGGPPPTAGMPETGIVELPRRSRRIRPVKGVAALRHILGVRGMNASGLARLLGVHASMGSKVLKGDRALTGAHIRRLAAKFKVRPDTFLD